MFGDIPVCQPLEEGQYGRHRTARDSVVGKDGMKPQEARVTARGPGAGSIKMLSADPASGWQQAEGPQSPPPHSSLGQARDCQ